MTAVSGDQRHKKANPCPICGGGENDPRGKSKRCDGYTSLDRKWAFCSREEHGGTPCADGRLFRHLLRDEPLDTTIRFSGPAPRTVAEYDYQNEQGELLYQVVRLQPKSFRQRVPDGSGGWSWKLNGVRRVPYRLSELIADDGDRPVYIAEGEKDVDALRARGLTATCNAGGAGKFGSIAETARRVLAGRDVIVIADNDKSGIDHAHDVVQHLRGSVASIKIMVCPSGHKDVSDHFAAGGDVGELVQLPDDETAEEPAKDEATPAEKAPVGRSVADIFAGWSVDGALVRQSTGIEAIDTDTRGGLVYGHRIYLVGAPNAGKTALALILAYRFALAGVYVGLLAVDEDADDQATRIAQMMGWQRTDAEERDRDVLSAMVDAAKPLPIVLFDASVTLEQAATELDALAKSTGKRAALFADSIQTVKSDAGCSAESERERIECNVAAVRDVAGKHKMIVVSTVEMNRGAYRSVEAAEQSNDMAAAKGSSAVEYSAKLLIALRSVKNEPDMIAARIVKNKAGPSGREWFMRLDHARHEIAECDGPAVADEDIEAAKLARAGKQLAGDVEAVAKCLLERPGLAGKRDVRDAMRGKGMGTTRIDAAISALMGANRVENRGTENRPKWHLKGGANVAT